MVKLGFWQYDKAQQKLALQATYDARLHESPVQLPPAIKDVEQWRYRHVRVKGIYDTRYQILLDNQVENEVAGYHVITPFKLEGEETTVLVDRGWIPMGNRDHLPIIPAPQALTEINGVIWIPSTKFYELAPPQPSNVWQPLWQNMDMKRYTRSVPFAVFPFVVRLDADSGTEGFVRNWPKPAERVETNIGYAWQWWGFSVAVVLIWIFVNLKRKSA